MNELIKYFNNKYSKTHGKIAYPRTTLQIYQVYQIIKSSGIEDEKLNKLLDETILPKPKTTEEKEAYAECIYESVNIPASRKYVDGNFPKKTSIEDKKIYLLKENGEKIDQGTELPSLQEQAGQGNTIQIFTDLATTEVTFDSDKTILESLDALIDTVEIEVNQVFRGQSYASDNPISGNCEIQIEILKTKMNNGARDVVCQVTLTSTTDSPYKWMMLTRRTAGMTSSQISMPLTPMITDVNKKYVDNSLKNKVDKVTGKGLSTVDFTKSYETKLKGLENYNDAKVKKDIETISTQLGDIAKQTGSIPHVVSEKVLCEVTQEQLATAWTQCQASTNTSMYIELPIFDFKDDIYSLHYIMINNKTYLVGADYNEEFSETSTRHFFEFYDVNDEINNIYGGCIGTKYDINWDDDETKVIIKIDRIDKTKPPVFTSNVQLIEKELMPFDYNYLGKHIILNQPVTVGYRKEGEVGGYSISIGFNNLAANSSFACGYSAEATGDYSHAEGNNTTSSGRCSHAEGIYTQATGDYSHAEGSKTKASSPNQHVQGKYNIEDTNGKYAHIVGNGTNNNKSNAHTLDWEGNAWYAGKLSQEGTPTEDKDLITKKYFDNGISSLPQVSFNENGELVVTINGVSKIFVPKA